MRYFVLTIAVAYIADPVSPLDIRKTTAKRLPLIQYMVVKCQDSPAPAVHPRISSVKSIIDRKFRNLVIVHINQTVSAILGTCHRVQIVQIHLLPLFQFRVIPCGSSVVFLILLFQHIFLCMYCRNGYVNFVCPHYCLPARHKQGADTAQAHDSHCLFHLHLYLLFNSANALYQPFLISSKLKPDRKP